MTTIVAGNAFSSRDPLLVVENKLDPGAWTFRLVVVDNDGNESAPQNLTVGVVRLVVPTPTPTPSPTGPIGIDPSVPTGAGTVDPRVALDTTPAPTPVDPGPVVAPATPVSGVDPSVIIRRPG